MTENQAEALQEKKCPSLCLQPIYANHEPYEPDENLEYVYRPGRTTYALYLMTELGKQPYREEAGKSEADRPFETYIRELPQSASWIFPLKMLLTVMKEGGRRKRDDSPSGETAGRGCETQLKLPVCRRQLLRLPL